MAGTMLESVSGAIGSNLGSALVFNPVTNMIYTMNASTNTVTVIDAATYTPVATISLATQPYNLALNPSTNTLYVASNAGNSVIVINGANNTVTTTLALTLAPSQLAVDASTNTVYVLMPTSVGVINGSNNTLTTVALSASIYATDNIAINASNGYVYVTGQSSGGYAYYLSILSGTYLANTLTLSSATYQAGSFVAINPTSGYIYATYEANTGIYYCAVFDNISSQVGTVQLPGYPYGVVYNPANNLTYVVTGGGTTVMSGYTAGANVQMYYSVPLINTTTNTLYYLSGSNIEVFDGATNILVGTYSNPVSSSLQAVTSGNVVYGLYNGSLYVYTFALNATTLSTINSLVALSGGRKIQSGSSTVSGTSSGGNYALSFAFPVAFATTPILVIGSNTGAAPTTPGAYNVTTTSVGWVQYVNSGSYSFTVNWIAVGS